MTPKNNDKEFIDIETYQILEENHYRLEQSYNDLDDKYTEAVERIRLLEKVIVNNEIAKLNPNK